MNLASAIRRFPVLALLPVVIVTAAGITLGLRRHPIYTASSEINVGVPDVTSQATPGYVEAAQSLASAYSRQVDSQNIYALVSRKLGMSQAVVASRLSSSAVPSSPTFFINATGPSPSAAVHLTLAATAALQHTINVLQQGEGASAILLNRYRQAQSIADQLANRQRTLQQGSSTASTSPRVQQAKLNAQVAQLQAQALAGQYTQAATTTRGAIIEVLNPPTSASNDRASITERYGLIGAAAGLILGAVLALAVANVRARRPATRSLESATSS